MVLYELSATTLRSLPAGRVRPAPRGPPDPTKRRVGGKPDAPDYIRSPGTR